MSPSTTPSTAATAPVDEDLAEQARPGYGIPSQDPRTGAQTALEPEDAEREAHSALMGGGMMAGAAAGAAVGVAVAGPVGVVVGSTLGGIAGYAMASVFHDTVQADVEQTLRVSQTLRELPPEAAALLPFRPVDVLAITPSQSLDALAQTYASELPRLTRHALEGLGALQGGGAALASYLLFEPGFVRALMDLGEQDAYARKAEILAFLGAASHRK